MNTLARKLRVHSIKQVFSFGPQRHFADPLGGTVNELIQKQLWDPEFQEKFFQHEKKQDSLRKINRKSDD